jgi:hypothetical protein
VEAVISNQVCKIVALAFVLTIGILLATAGAGVLNANLAQLLEVIVIALKPDGLFLMAYYLSMAH